MTPVWKNARDCNFRITHADLDKGTTVLDDVNALLCSGKLACDSDE